MPQNKWLRAFTDFMADIRINSKEIVSPDPRGVPLVLWESQKRFIHEVGTGLDEGVHQFNCLKARQQGITTASLAIDVLWLAMHDGITGAMVTDNDGNKAKNRAEITRYISSFPEGYFGEGRFGIKISNRDLMEFTNGATLRFLVAGTKKKSIAWAEGTGYAFIHMTEVSKYANGVTSLLEGFAQNNPHRLLLMESTANGWNHWQERYTAGKADPLTQRSFFIGWWANDMNRIEQSDARFVSFGREKPNKEEYERIVAVKQLYGWEITKEQLAWIRWRGAGAHREQDLLSQNQPWTERDAFVQSGYSFFEVRLITKDMRRVIEDQRENKPSSLFKAYRYEADTEADGDRPSFFTFGMERLKSDNPNAEDLIELKVWEEPVKDGKYVIGFDCAYGREDSHKDGNVIEVFRCYADKMVQVAEYATYGVDLRIASWVFFHLCAAYVDVMGNIEIGGPGRLVMQEFKHLRELLAAEMNQAKVKERDWEEAASQARWYLYHKPDSLGAGYVYNFETNWRTKPDLMTNIKSCYLLGEVVIRSRKLLDEMALVQVDADGGIGAPESPDPDKKDDRVFAMAFAAKAWTDWRRSEMLALGLTYEMVQKIENEEISPVTIGVNNIVHRWMAKQEAMLDEEPPRGSPYHIENGLV